MRIERMVSLWGGAFTVASHAASSARMRQAGAPARCSVWVTPHATCRGLPLEHGGAAVHGVVLCTGVVGGCCDFVMLFHEVLGEIEDRG